MKDRLKRRFGWSKENKGILRALTSSKKRGPLPIHPKQLITGSGCDKGKERAKNEDALFAFTATLATESKSHAHPFGLFIVADGMGGHQGGEIASESAVQAMANYLLRELYLPRIETRPAAAPKTSQRQMRELMHLAVGEADRAVHEASPYGGTTLTAVLIIGDKMTIAHVGDSRAYLIIDSQKKMKLLTRDHSIVKQLEELGQLSAEEGAAHPYKSVLYQALGQGGPLEPDIFTKPFPQNGSLLLCSDGLWGTISEEEIAEIATSAASPHLGCAALIQAANAQGGPDNIAAILVRMAD